MTPQQRKPISDAKPLVLLSVRVPADLHQRLKLRAVRGRIPIQRLVEQALRDLLRQKE